MEANVIIGQLFGIVTTIIMAISYQVNNNKMLLALQTGATLCNCLGYMFLGAMTGFVLNIVCIIRNLVFYFFKPGTFLYRISTAVLVAAMIFCGVLSWEGPVSLLMIIALALNTFFMSLGVPQTLRYSILLTSSMVLTYNAIVFTVGGILNEGVAIVSSAIGIVRFKKAKSEGASQSK